MSERQFHDNALAYYEKYSKVFYINISISFVMKKKE